MSNLSARPTREPDAALGFDVSRANDLISELDCEWPCKWLCEWHYFEEIDSTNQFLLTYSGSVHGHVCVADKQTKGRGRMGRQWQGSNSANVAFSLGWQPDHPIGSALSLVVGVAAAETLCEFNVPEVGLKWPNDILAGKQKLGGILVEAVNQGSDAHYVIGVGVNLRLSENESKYIEQAWTDFHHLGLLVDRTELIVHMVSAVASSIDEYAHSGIKPFRDRWNELHVYDQQNVDFILGDELCNGKVAGVSDDGALLMQINGQQRSFVAGEIKVTLK